MAIDTPARLAILGASPLGLEAAIYARFLGYDVEVFEEAAIGGYVRRRGHVRSFVPFEHLHSPLGLAAIAAQDERYKAPRNDDYLTGDEWLERYLAPLAATDLIADQIRTATRVVAIGRAGCLRGELYELAADDNDPDAVYRGDYAFRLLLENEAGEERIAEFDGIIDATENFGAPNYLGESGIPAVGERAARRDASAPLTYDIPDALGTQRERYAGRHTLVIGAGDSAATTIERLAKLSLLAPGTRVTWIMRHVPAAGETPLPRIPDDPWPKRDALRAALAGFVAPQGPVEVWSGNAVQSLARDEVTGGWQVELLGTRAGRWPFDQIVANVGWQAGHEPLRALHVEVEATSDRVREVEPLVTHEPHYHVLGGKRAGRGQDATFCEGLDDIRALFALLGDRPSLDLYRGAIRLP